MSLVADLRAELANIEGDAKADVQKVITLFESKDTELQAALKTIEAKGLMVIEKLEADVIAATPVIKLVTAVA